MGDAFQNRVFRYRVFLAERPPEKVCGLLIRHFFSAPGERYLRIIQWREMEVLIESPFAISRPDFIVLDFLVDHGEIKRHVLIGVKSLEQFYP